MLISTTEYINGKLPKKTLGIVRGNTIRARWFGRDIVAGLKNIVGGEIRSYTKMLTDARDQAIERMKEETRKKGGNAVTGVRFTTSDVMQGAAEILAYGTAVVL
ncbi:heavy metal-binding domain-containing protein [Candidatus Pacearchaeota archaeon]|nr:heavy metal-binding domain-containing protein [Candidatus Pacearchaeota archaeon]